MEFDWLFRNSIYLMNDPFQGLQRPCVVARSWRRGCNFMMKKWLLVWLLFLMPKNWLCYRRFEIILIFLQGKRSCEQYRRKLVQIKCCVGPSQLSRSTKPQIISVHTNIERQTGLSRTIQTSTPYLLQLLSALRCNLRVDPRRNHHSPKT